jgi:hypothetical protein
MTDILQKLQGGDRRSIGRVDDVVEAVQKDPSLFEDLFFGMLNEDPIIRMRSADAVEKITVEHPEYLMPFKTVLLEIGVRSEQQEVRWHMAQVFPRIEWKAGERKKIIEILIAYLEDNSKIVKTFSMQALAEFALSEPKLRIRVIHIIENLVETGSPAMKSRGKKLLARLKPSKGKG